MIATTSRPAPAASPAGHSLLRDLVSRPYPAVMGVLNLTPDSFSDGGQFIAPERALTQARRMIAEGADIIDVGAESTRPYGAQPVSAEEEQKRLQPVLSEIVALGIPVSIDSMKSEVAAWALDAGAAIANDVWGLQRDPEMAELVAQHDVPVIIMHNRDSADAGIDIMKDIAGFFERSLEIAAKAGISAENIVLDPGIGFGKTPEQSMIGAGAAWRTQGVRPAAAGRRLAQAVHRPDHALGAAPAPRRLDCRASAGGQGRRADHPHP